MIDLDRTQTREAIRERLPASVTALGAAVADDRLARARVVGDQRARERQVERGRRRFNGARGLRYRLAKRAYLTEQVCIGQAFEVCCAESGPRGWRSTRDAHGSRVADRREHEREVTDLHRNERRKRGRYGARRQTRACEELRGVAHGERGEKIGLHVGMLPVAARLPPCIESIVATQRASASARREDDAHVTEASLSLHARYIERH